MYALLTNHKARSKFEMEALHIIETITQCNLMRAPELLFFKLICSNINVFA